MQKNTPHKGSKTRIKKVTKHDGGTTANKSATSKKIARFESLAEFRSKIHARGKPLSQIVIEGRG